MGQGNASRVQTREESHTFVSPSLRGILFEIDGRLNHANCWLSITRTSGLITQTDYYRDAAKTNLAFRRVFGRTVVDGISFITSITTTYYETDGSTVDSTVTTTISRDGASDDQVITGCASPFTTTEDAEEC